MCIPPAARCRMPCARSRADKCSALSCILSAVLSCVPPRRCWRRAQNNLFSVSYLYIETDIRLISNAFWQKLCLCNVLQRHILCKGTTFFAKIGNMEKKLQKNRFTLDFLQIDTEIASKRRGLIILLIFHCNPALDRTHQHLV